MNVLSERAVRPLPPRLREDLRWRSTLPEHARSLYQWRGLADDVVSSLVAPASDLERAMGTPELDLESPRLLADLPALAPTYLDLGVEDQTLLFDLHAASGRAVFGADLPRCEHIGHRYTRSPGDRRLCSSRARSMAVELAYF